MNALLAALSVALAAAVALTVPGGASAVLLCACAALSAGVLIARAEERESRFLLQVFVGGLLVRLVVGTLINAFHWQEFFGGDALTYDLFGNALLHSLRRGVFFGGEAAEWARSAGNGWGMIYLVAAIYAAVGRNMLAVQYFNAVVGAATAPVIFLCARHIFQNLRVDTHHQQLLIIGTVENADLASLRKALRRSPKVVVVQFFRRRRLERPHVHSLRIHSRHDVFDRSVLSSGVHALKNQKQAPTVLRRENILQAVQFLDAVGEQFLRLRLHFRAQSVRVCRFVILEREMFPVLDAVALEELVDFHRVICVTLP